MTAPSPADPDASTETTGKSALKSCLDPGRAEMKRASALSVCAGVIWPIQAALIAYALGGLVTGAPVSGIAAALGFAALGALRAALSWRADGLADMAAERVIRAARGRIVETEARRAGDSPFGGAGSIAALAGEKLDHLGPYVRRYGPARMRVMVVPLVILALALTQSWAVGIILIISGPLIPVFMALVGMAAKEASERQMAEIGSLNDLLIDRLSALVDIRLLGARDRVAEGFASQAGDLRQRTMAVLRVAFLSSTVLELFSAIGVAMVAVYVGFTLLGTISFGGWGGPLSTQAGIFVLLLVPEFYQPLRDLAAAWHDKAAADAVAGELAAWEASDAPVLIGQGGPAARLAGAATVALTGCVLPGGIRLADIEIKAGEAVALVGPSGAGKTSILRVMAGLLRPEAGEVSVAGQDLSAATADGWRARIGWMPQAPHFLNASLRENVTMGDGGDPAPALARAAVADVVAALPHGVNTRLGETGGGLSGGEARRVTLARAIHGAPDVILADEPTADLDAATARAVADGLLAEAGQGATLIVATHDAGLAARMDRVIEIGARL